MRLRLSKAAIAIAAIPLTATLLLPTAEAQTQGPSLSSTPSSILPLRVGLTGKYPPFNYFNSNGELTGFDVDFAKAICKQIQRKCDFKILQWDGVIGSLQAGHIDTIIGSMAITPAREKQVLFSAPYYESGAQLFTRDANPKPHTPGYKIGVTLGTTYESFIKRRYPGAEVRTYKGDIEVMQDVISGRLDALVTDKLVGAYLNKKSGGHLHLFGDLLYEERIGIPVTRENKALHKQLNDAVIHLRNSSQYNDLLNRYFGISRASSDLSPTVLNSQSLSLLLQGLWATFKVSSAGIVLGLVAGFALAAITLFLPRSIAVVTLAWIDFIRATPFMVQLFAIYFGLPAVGWKIGAWNAALATIAIHSSAYLAEVIKSAYLAVPSGQHHASQVLGLSKLEAIRYVILPQMFPTLTAPTLNTVVAMIKDSAIVSVIGVYELTLQAQQLISTSFRPMQFYILAALLYFLLTYPLLFLGRKAEQYFRKQGLLHDHAAT